MIKARNRTNGASGKPVNLALQGGGSHGAFTWGVLDRLLEDGRITFSAVSGTSAGAMNAVALADGYARDGHDGARQKLSEFWEAVAEKGRFSPLQRSPLDIWLGTWSIENNPALFWYETMSRTMSPELANPLGYNPLRDVVEEVIDFDRVRACAAFDVLVSATNVETGHVRVFGRHEIGIDHVMASACLPTLFPAVIIDDVPYWDGGYGGNPALFPFFYTNHIEDLLLVQINPIRREGVPRTARDIQNRIDEITFNAGLLREFRAIAFVKRLIAEGKVTPEEYRDIRLHRIDADDALKSLGATTKLSTERAFLLHLRDLGRAAASDWLDENFAFVGQASSVDLLDELDPGMAAQLDAKPRRQMGEHVRNFIAKRLKAGE